MCSSTNSVWLLSVYLLTILIGDGFRLSCFPLDKPTGYFCQVVVIIPVRITNQSFMWITGRKLWPAKYFHSIFIKCKFIADIFNCNMCTIRYIITVSGGSRICQTGSLKAGTNTQMWPMLPKPSDSSGLKVTQGYFGRWFCYIYRQNNNFCHKKWKRGCQYSLMPVILKNAYPLW